MQRFKSKLVPGGKTPYTSWTFVVVPEEIRAEWARARCDVRGTIGGAPFRGTVAKGEGVYRMPVKRELLEKIGASCGNVVEVAIELDDQPRPIDVPRELDELLKRERALAQRFETLAPSLKRAWATYIGAAKQPETRARRAQKAPAGIRSKSFPSS